MAATQDLFLTNLCYVKDFFTIKNVSVSASKFRLYSLLRLFLLFILFFFFFQYEGGAIVGTLKTSLSPILVHSGRNSASPIKVWASFVLSADVMGCYVLIVIGPMIYGWFMPRPHTPSRCDLLPEQIREQQTSSFFGCEHGDE